ncbi:uncharacterized protein DUF2795 [Nocardia tenerifensis]|uniref:Uncharacterized protein DUF2795 n=1 Tax=Nocardia tenerifensis TaxID=228006 RepID=A0A318JXI4_9NOCA|nr:DUF2795 domain-containing protein [Nocardia tenerifensis]PXX59135.1 uncharacterized protein DUF2795 [Nocardia tenerifensis]
MVNPIELQKYLHGVDYPCDRDGLVQAARSNGADNDVISQLQRIPDRTYDGPSGVSQEVSR